MLQKRNLAVKKHTDEKLMEAIHIGDVHAFDELYLRYKDRILYYFYRMLGNSVEKAQDFLQDLFMKIIEKPQLFDPSRRFSTWIFSVAHNMCKNEYRSLKVREVVTRYENLDNLSEISDNIEEDRIKLATEIFKIIENLDDFDKSAFILRYREGFSIKEISDVLQIPEGTVKSRLFYARKWLLENLKTKVELSN